MMGAAGIGGAALPPSDRGLLLPGGRSSFVGFYSSPLGAVTLSSDGSSLTGLWFEGQKYDRAGLTCDPEELPLPVFEETRRWLDLYFAGRQPGFTPPLAPDGTPFRRRVWEALLTIPYGATVTYGEIAEALAADGVSTSPRAVGGAVGHNPISLIIPCHRVVGAGGSLTGYAGGTDKKAFLLQLEGIRQQRDGAVIGSASRLASKQKS